MNSMYCRPLSPYSNANCSHMMRRRGATRMRGYIVKPVAEPFTTKYSIPFNITHNNNGNNDNKNNALDRRLVAWWPGIDNNNYLSA